MALPLLLIAYLGFISLSLPDVVIGVAWPSLRDEFGLAQSGLGVLLIGFGSGYLCSSFAAGVLVARLGIGNLLTLSSALVLLALFGYALTPLWAGVALAAMLLGLGSGAIDVGLNIYGARYFSAGQMNWLHASWGLGAMLGPLLMTWTLAGGGSWRDGYLTVAVLIAAMTVLFAASRRRWRRPPESATGGAAMTALRLPRAWLQIALFFVYTGLEAAAGHWSFTLFSEGRGVTLAIAGVWVAAYWGALAAGRLLFGFVVGRIGGDRLLGMCGAGAVAAALMVAQPWQPLSFLGLALLGLCLAPFFPCLIADTPRRLGAAADHAIGLQIGAALLGGALWPALIGVLIPHFSLAVIAPALLFLTVTLTGLFLLLRRLTAPA